MTKALSIENLGKQYRIAGKEHFWALKNVNLNLEEGSVLGLIGANGAGKSTLLKILSRITAPSEGRVRAYGKMASLLEVGTGFHPELSGRENIYLNGSILGMSRASIRQQFDAIVDFAGVERFLDMPVKRYSSGMFVRLAFAVAAHLDAEILLIDEVLAVGDADFQKRCLQRMDSLAKEKARSIIFVSHNMGAIAGLCDQVAWLDQGQIKQIGEPTAVIEAYLNGLETLQADIPIRERTDREGDGRARFTAIETHNGEAKKSIAQNGPLQVDLSWKNNSEAKSQRIELHLFNSRGNYLSSFKHELSPEQKQCSLKLPKVPLMPGRFFFNVHLYLDGIRADFVGRAVYFEVIGKDWEANEIAVQRQNPGIVLEAMWLNEA